MVRLDPLERKTWEGQRGSLVWEVGGRIYKGIVMPQDSEPGRQRWPLETGTGVMSLI